MLGDYWKFIRKDRNPEVPYQICSLSFSGLLTSRVQKSVRLSVNCRVFIPQALGHCIIHVLKDCRDIFGTHTVIEHGVELYSNSSGVSF